ncbi:MAG: hypothetical protein HUU20_18415 [Pirellulales bacterium]|nr:hypothetical protein [Pirellulales bacterium]
MRTLLAAMLAVGLSTPIAFARKWTDSTGKYTVDAEFVDFKDAKVHLKKEDGTPLSLPLEKLSATDQDFVRKAAGLPGELNTDDDSSEKPRRQTSTGVPKPSGKRVAKPRAEELDDQAAAGLIGGEKGPLGPLAIGPLRLGMNYPQVWSTLPLVVGQSTPDGGVRFVKPPPRVVYDPLGPVLNAISGYQLRFKDGSYAQMSFSPPDPGVVTAITFHFLHSKKAPVAFVVSQYSTIYGEPKRFEHNGSTDFTWTFKDQGVDRELRVTVHQRDNTHSVELRTTHQVEVGPKPR